MEAKTAEGIALRRVPIAPTSPERLEPLIGERFDRVREGMERAHQLLRGRVVWMVNSTSKGGGVVELLESLLPYARGSGVDARWLVVEAPPEFFKVTKRMHNLLHGVPGDGDGLGAEALEVYDRVSAEAGPLLAALIEPGDMVVLHDPQTAGLVQAAKDAGAHVVWRCHVGVDEPNELVRQGWEELLPRVLPADLFIFSRPEFAWDGIPPERLRIVPPSIDALSPKNQDMPADVVDAIVERIGLQGGNSPALPVFTRHDGTPSRVDRQAAIWQAAPITPETPLVCQVSRWDRLKDPAGLLEAFGLHCCDRAGAHLALVGPNSAAVADDPEGAEVIAEVTAQAEQLPAGFRERVHLVSLPMEDPAENAAMVNALQRRATIVVQKSIAEGFGLTVAEAMWKAAPVVASNRGGIQDQVMDGESGLLVDPTDLVAVGAAIDRLLDNPDEARRLGENARERIRREFLGDRQLLQYLAVLAELIASEG